ncbi:MAG TPA: polyhydroxyalkanoic acid system family protein [Thermoanaerobaculia bacterium]
MPQVVRFATQTNKSFGEFQLDLNAALQHAWGTRVMRYHWEGEVLRITAPGAEGFVAFKPGGVEAEIGMSFPATMLKTQIVADITRTLSVASGSPVQSANL